MRSSFGSETSFVTGFSSIKMEAETGVVPALFETLPETLIVPGEVKNSETVKTFRPIFTVFGVPFIEIVFSVNSISL